MALGRRRPAPPPDTARIQRYLRNNTTDRLTDPAPPCSMLMPCSLPSKPRPSPRYPSRRPPARPPAHPGLPPASCPPSSMLRGSMFCCWSWINLGCEGRLSRRDINIECCSDLEASWVVAESPPATAGIQGHVPGTPQGIINTRPPGGPSRHLSNSPISSSTTLNLEVRGWGVNI